MSEQASREALKASFHAVAVYDLGNTHPELVDYRGVLATMQGGGDGAFLLPDLKERLVADTWPVDAPQVLSLLDGSHPSGFRLSIIKAMSHHEEISMPVIEDPHTRRTLAIGPETLPKKLAQKLHDAGITYVAGGDGHAKEDITRFIVDTVTQRIGLQAAGQAPDYFRDRDSANKFAEDFMMAAISAADFGRDPPAFRQENPGIADMLLPISQGSATATIYTAAARTGVAP